MSDYEDSNHEETSGLEEVIATTEETSSTEPPLDLNTPPALGSIDSANEAALSEDSKNSENVNPNSEEKSLEFYKTLSITPKPSSPEPTDEDSKHSPHSAAPAIAVVEEDMNESEKVIDFVRPSVERAADALPIESVYSTTQQYQTPSFSSVAGVSIPGNNRMSSVDLESETASSAAREAEQYAADHPGMNKGDGESDAEFADRIKQREGETLEQWEERMKEPPPEIEEVRVTTTQHGNFVDVYNLAMRTTLSNNGLRIYDEEDNSFHVDVFQNKDGDFVAAGSDGTILSMSDKDIQPNEGEPVDTQSGNEYFRQPNGVITDKEGNSPSPFAPNSTLTNQRFVNPPVIEEIVVNGKEISMPGHWDADNIAFTASYPGISNLIFQRLDGTSLTPVSMFGVELAHRLNENPETEDTPTEVVDKPVTIAFGSNSITYIITGSVNSDGRFQGVDTSGVSRLFDLDQRGNLIPISDSQWTAR